MKNPENLEQKKCGESCGCMATDDSKKEEIKSEEKIEQDPTRFGDWPVNCRAIDF